MKTLYHLSFKSHINNRILSIILIALAALPVNGQHFQIVHDLYAINHCSYDGRVMVGFDAGNTSLRIRIDGTVSSLPHRGSEFEINKTLVSGDGSSLVGELKRAAGSHLLHYNIMNGAFTDLWFPPFFNTVWLPRVSNFVVSFTGDTVIAHVIYQETYLDGTSYRFVRWINGEAELLNTPFESFEGTKYLVGMSEDTLIVNYRTYTLINTLYKYNISTKSLTPYNLGEYFVRLVSSDGRVFAGQAGSFSNTQPFRWEDGNVALLGYAIGAGVSRGTTEPLNLSRDGSVVLGVETLPDGPSIFRFSTIWTKTNGIRKMSTVFQDDYGFDLSGIDLNEHYVYGFNARYMSPDGVVVGRAFLGDKGVGWYAVLRPDEEKPIVVNSIADLPNLPDETNCRTGRMIEIDGAEVPECTLRAAIEALNNRARADSISFNIDGGGSHTVVPLSPLPNVSYPVVLDATTQPGYNGFPMISLNGMGNIENGLVIEGGESVVRGFSIGGCTNAGILISGLGDNIIEANHIGVNAAGTTSIPNRTGLIIDNSPDNQVGGADLSQMNVISGNTDGNDLVKMREERTGIGIMIQGAGSTGNRVQGNRIGTDYSGQQAIGNGNVGVFIYNASENLIGGDEPSHGNIISANEDGNLTIFGRDATDNIISGNIIGTNLEGTKSLTQSGSGVLIFSGSRNRIGGSTDTPGKAPGNLISGHNGGGVVLGGINPEALSSESENPEIGIAMENIIAGNLIGTNRVGTSALPNQTGVVAIYDAHKTMIGGDQSGYRNVISGNEVGIILADTTGGFAPHETVIAGNYIGTNIHGNAALGNNGPGILVTSLSRFHDGSTGIAGVRIGGVANSSRNIVAGNKEKQIEILGPVSSGTLILNNYIGVLANGQAGQTPADSEYGLMIKTNETFIGEDPEGNAAPNVIGGNQYGIVLVGDVNAVGGGNKIGTNPGGTVAVPNHTGIWVLGNNNIILGNTVSGNKNYGIEIGQQPGSPAFEGEFFNPDNTTIVRNMIGTNSQGTSAIGNGLGENGAGLVFWRGSNLHLYINTISGNHHGVHIANSPFQAGTQMSANIIGGGGVVPNEISGTVALPEFVPVPNLGDGVHITDGRVYMNNEPKNDLLADVKVGNFIQNNLGAGVRRTGSNLSSHFELLSNYFFSNSGLAIDFGPEGVGAGSSMHEPPVLMQPVFSEETARIRGVSAVNGIIQLYTTPICHPSGHGEGRLYLSEKDQVVSSGQEFSTEVSLPQNLRVGYYVTALVTHNNRTSEFCPCVRIADEDKYQEQLLDELYLKAINLLNLTLNFSDTKSGVTTGGKNSLQDNPYRIYASEFNFPPDHSFFEGSVLTPGGTEIIPTKIDTTAYWTLGAVNITNPLYDICVDISGNEFAGNHPHLVLVHRSGIGEPWKPLDTTMSEEGTLCASGLTSFGDIAIAAYDGSAPTSIAFFEKHGNSDGPFTLFQNYPNPFSHSTIIPFSLAKGADVRVIIYDFMGRMTALVTNAYYNAGNHEVRFSAEKLPAGIYFCRFESNGLTSSKKMMVVK